MANNEPHERLAIAKPHLAEHLDELHADLDINAAYKVLKHCIEVNNETPDQQLERAYKELADSINTAKGLAMHGVTAADLCPPDNESRRQHISDTSKLKNANAQDIVRWIIKGAMFHGPLLFQLGVNCFCVSITKYVCR